MAWTAPRTWVAGEIVTAALGNTHWRDNLRYLKGLDGVPTIESGLTIDNTDGDERLLLPLLTTAQCATVLNAEGEIAFDSQTHQMKEYDGTAVRAVISEADVDDTPVNGATTVPISSNWAYDYITAQKAPYFARKTADIAANNDATLNDDADLFIAIGANTTWLINFYINILQGSNDDANFKYAITVPAAAAIAYGGTYTIALAVNATDQMTVTSGAEMTVDVNQDARKLIVIRCIVANGANAGNVQFQWCQNSAQAVDTKVLANSCLLAHQLV